MTRILDLFRLDDRVAIVTGSGRGIGAATALAYAEAGADVVVSARTIGQLEETAEKVRALLPDPKSGQGFCTEGESQRHRRRLDPDRSVGQLHER